jgi:hypothetical protein
VEELDDAPSRHAVVFLALMLLTLEWGSEP